MADFRRQSSDYPEYRRRDERSLRVDAVSYEPVPAETFAPPDGVRTPETGDTPH